MLTNLTLRTRMLIVALLGTSGTLIVGGVGYLGLNRSLSATRSLARTAVMQRQQMEADMMHDAIRADVYSALLAATAADSARGTSAVVDLDEHVRTFHGSITSISGSGPSARLLARITELRPQLDAYAQAARRLVHGAGSDTASARTELSAFEAQFKVLEEQMEAFGDIIGEESAAAATTSATLFLRAKVVMVIVSIAIIAISLLASMLVERRVTRGLRAVCERADALRRNCVTSLNNAIVAMARGDLSVPVTCTTEPLQVGSRDEIGALTMNINEIIAMSRSTVQAFNDARSSVQRLVSEASEMTASAEAGRLSHRGNELAFEGSFRDVVRGVNGTLDAVTAPIIEATTALERLAQRDLTATVAGTFAGEHAKIQLAFNSAVGGLSRALSEVRGTADEVAAGAERIAAGSGALAHSASEQASALEEISASARELAAMTRRNAESASEGRVVAQSAELSTTQGVGEVERLAEAMQRIKVSAEATARIIRTIDEIAFQTNLLALNAAVEAARAGDSGRGFAVVADEVRSLALRSADAARSTASLIEESVRSTDLGVAINGRVMTQLSDIQGRVRQMGEVVSAIAAASDEQSKGVTLIDSALEDMTRRTQVVAAHADESRDAAVALQHESRTMHELVSGFHLPSAPPATSRVSQKGTDAVAVRRAGGRARGVMAQGRATHTSPRVLG